MRTITQLKEIGPGLGIQEASVTVSLCTYALGCRGCTGSRWPGGSVGPRAEPMIRWAYWTLFY